MGERELGSDGRMTLYRVAQEALTNIRKHACADRVEVRLAYETAGARLTSKTSNGQRTDRHPEAGPATA